MSRRRLALRYTVAALAVMTPGASRAQPPSPPPQALPLHSALPEDARRYGFSGVPVIEANTTLPPPSASAPDFVPLPPLALPPPPGPTFSDEPPPAPLFSWKPTYIPPGAKSGMLQQALVRGTYLPNMGDDGFGMIDVTKQVTLAVPPFISGSPFLITPAFTAHFLDGPASIHVPSQLYSVELEVRYMKQVTSRLGMDLAVAPSYFGDSHVDISDAFRVTGRALFGWDWTPTLKLVAGGLYLGREDYPAIPVGGVVWKPSPDWRFELVVPRPRIYRRFSVNCDVEHFVYLGGEVGGNTWTIDRGFGPEKFTYGDLRAVLGYNRAAKSGLNARFEIGWVFDREIEFDTVAPGFLPADTLMARGEVSY
jgi:hypothetical protein